MGAGKPSLFESRTTRILSPERGVVVAPVFINGEGVKGVLHAAAKFRVMELLDEPNVAEWRTEGSDRIPHADEVNRNFTRPGRQKLVRGIIGGL